MSLLTLRPVVEETFEDIKAGKDVDVMFHVSGPIFLSMKSPYTTVNIRRWFMKDGVKYPTTKGVVLRTAGWQKLFGLEHKMESYLQILKGVLPCFFVRDHDSVKCVECNPWP